MKAMRIKLEVTQREFDAILAGLRLYQRAQAWLANYGEIDIYAIACEHGQPLSAPQVDRLCERLNVPIGTPAKRPILKQKQE